MMDEYIPSPRQTPNKPRRMRDVSALYPVDEQKLLLEALLKKQREGSSGDAGRGRARATDGPAGDSSPPQQRCMWREERGCPVCRWSNKSSASSGSEYDGDESDDTSVGDDHRAIPESSSISSSSEEENDGNNDAEGNSEAGEGNAQDTNKNNDGENAVVPDDNGRNVHAEEVSQTNELELQISENSEDAPPEVGLPHIAESKDRPPEREGFPSPGKLLYGRHCLWYQSAGFIRPQGGK